MGITPEFLFDFESNMQAITEDEYSRIASNLWWSRIMKTRPSSSKKELLAWMLSTAKIEDLETAGGKVPFEDLVSTYSEFTNKHAGAGLRLKRSELEDLDGKGLDQAGKWSRDIGAYMAYWPQEQAVALLKNGATSGYTSYDGVTFFHAAHPVNPYDAGAGTYQNILTGAASGAYPGACPIDTSVAIDVALVNLAKAVAYIKSLKMPNGVTPRFLRPKLIIAPPLMQMRVVQLLDAKTLPQGATGGAGSGDVEAVIRSFGWDVPIIADELAGFESSTTYFIVCEELSSSELGGLVYIEREPFRIDYYTGQGGQNVQLDRMDELEWHCKGRNVAGYGHPYKVFKCKGS